MHRVFGGGKHLWLCISLWTVPATAQLGFQTHYVGLGQEDQAVAVVPDPAGNVFVVASVQGSQGFAAIRVAKLSSAGNRLAVYDFGDHSYASAAILDQHGDLLIVGATTSKQFPASTPITPISQDGAAFVAKLNGTSLGLLAATVIGGSKNWAPGQIGAFAKGVTTDQQGNVYITGSTSFTDFPTTAAAYMQAWTAAGSNHPPLMGFVCKFPPDLSMLLFSSAFWGNSVGCTTGSCLLSNYGSTLPEAISLDLSGNVIIAGYTNAEDLPTTAGAYARKCAPCGSALAGATANGFDGFISAFSADGKSLVWSTFLPATQPALGYTALEVDTLTIEPNGNVLVGGSAPANLPVTGDAVQVASGGGFISELDPQGTRLLFSSYFGGGVGSSVLGLSADTGGNLCLAGVSSFAALPQAPSSASTQKTGYVACLSAVGKSVLSLVTLPPTIQSAVPAPNQSLIVLGFPDWYLVPSPAASPLFITNAASGEVTGTFAPGEVVSLYGVGIGPSQPISGYVDPRLGVISSSLSDYQVKFNGIPSPLLWAGPNQINTVVPYEVRNYVTSDVAVSGPLGTVSFPSIYVAATRPEVFADPTSGFAYALNSDGTANSASNPASPGSIVSVWATGGGGNCCDGLIEGASMGLPVTAFAVLVEGASSLDVSYAGNAPGQISGVLQVNFRVPAITGLGNSVTLRLEAGDSLSHPFKLYVR